MLSDQARRLKRAYDDADRGALDAHQLGPISMGQGQDVIIDPVPRAQDPVAAPGLDRVDRIAGDGLEGLGQQGLVVASYDGI
jgi:hypothetical protein